MKLSKDQLATIVTSFVNLFDENVEMLKSAAACVDELKSEIITKQNEIINLHQNQIKSVEETVKSEFKTWADVAKSNCGEGTQVSLKTVKEAVISVQEEDLKANNFIIYGLEEDKDGDEEDLEDAVSATFKKAGVIPFPPVRSMTRIGVRNAEKVRPVKVQMTNSYQVQRILKAAHRLRQHTGEFRTVYLAPDRSKKEREEHNKLVRQMKELISQDSTKYYFIKNGKVMNVDKRLSTT